MRSYFTLLRLPYQLQLGPIFGWGYLLAGGSFNGLATFAHFAGVFLLFHIGAFGGLTALNSYYDRDTGPVGGLWQPPPPPARLLLFAWCVQLSGLFVLAFINSRAAVAYAAIVLLSLGYSHPRSRWKGHAWKSLATVIIGQGVLDYLAGTATAGSMVWGMPMWLGLVGASLTVAGFYPLTQLYQVADDTRRGDKTLAAVLFATRGRGAVFGWATALLVSGTAANAVALLSAVKVFDAVLVCSGTAVTALALHRWAHQTPPNRRLDFQCVHALMGYTAAAFGGYILLHLVTGGLYAR